MGKCVKEEKWRVRNYETGGKDKERGRGKKIFTTEGKEGDAWKNNDEEVK